MVKVRKQREWKAFKSEYNEHWRRPRKLWYLHQWWPPPMTGGQTPARNGVALVQKMDQRPFPCRASCPGKGSISERSLPEATVWVQEKQNASVSSVVEALHPCLQMCCRCSLVQLCAWQTVDGTPPEDCWWRRGMLAGQRKAVGNLQGSR